MPFAVVGTTVPKSANNRINAPQLYSCAHYHRFASAPTATAANGTKLVRPSQRREAHARRSSIHSSDDEWVTFDGEDEWNEQVGKLVRYHFFWWWGGQGEGLLKNKNIEVPCFSYVYATVTKHDCRATDLCDHPQVHSSPRPSKHYL
jgi:hypothetical protein